jgi:hypothetical protein
MWVTDSCRCRFFRPVGAALGFAALGACLTVVGCSRRPQVPPFEKILDAFHASKGSNEAPKPVMDLGIYIQLSNSVRGFVGVTPSNYRRVVEALLRGAQDAQFNVQRLRFSDTVTAADNFGPGDFLNVANFRGNEASLGMLMNDLETRKQNGRLNVIVTDLTGVEGHPGQPELGAALKEMASEKVALLVLGFRSAFSGEYEAHALNCPGQRPKLSTGQSLPGRGRPFYLIVTAPNQASIENFRQAVLTNLHPQVEFMPTSRPVDVEAGRPDLEKKSSLAIFDNTKPQADFGNTRRFYSSFTYSGPTDGKVSLKFRWPAKRNYRIDARKLKLEATSVQIDDRGNFSAQTNPMTFVASEPPKGKGDEAKSDDLEYEYKFSPPEKGGWVVYRIQMKGGVGNLPPPRWLGDWNAAEDCEAEAGNRTYQLESFADNLISALAQDTVFAEHYVAVRRP